MKINKIFIIITAVAVVLIIAGVLVLPKVLIKKSTQQIGCTMEAMICPDGSAVGRTGPNCEFAKCPELKTQVFGSIANLAVSKQVTFSDGLKVALKEINDSRCKPGVVCIWAGELSPLLHISGGSAGNLTGEVRLGTTNNKKVTKNGYVFELKSATETTATIMVTKELKNTGLCYVSGCSSEICSDRQDISSICIYKAEYACYKTATCARQNGQCGWTQTAALTECILHSN